MPKIDIERLKQAIPIMELARHLGLTIRGQQARCYNGQAHKHDDNNFSLGLDTKSNRYKCFACGESGSIIDLFMAIRGVDVSEAIKSLADMAGLTPMSHISHQKSCSAPNVPYTSPYKPIMQPASSNEPTGACSDIYEELILACGGLDKESRAYLTGATRGLTEETLSRFSLFSIKDYQKINNHLKGKFNGGELQRAGVIGRKGNLIFWKHKIIIPFVSEGRVVYLRGRYFYNGNAKANGNKMLGLIGKTTKRLFNAERLTALKKGDKIYVCEGEFDAMILEQNGYNTVAILGTTNFAPEMAGLFKGLDVILCLDNDEAGKRATNEIAKFFLLKGQKVSSKQLPAGIKDISDYFTFKKEVQTI